MIIICGIPNAGKTTYSERYNAVHYDDMNLTTRQRYVKLNEIIRQGDAVIEGVFGERKRRIEFVQSCPDGEKKTCIWLDTPLEVCLEREAAYRQRPASMVICHAQVFQPPTLSEGWDEIIIIRGGETLVESSSYKSKT